MSYDFGKLNAMVYECGTWADKTFSKATPESITEHLRREVLELIEHPDDSEECADCMLLLFHLAHKQGWSMEQAIMEKFAKNKGRVWGEPDAHGVVEHIES